MAVRALVSAYEAFVGLCRTLHWLPPLLTRISIGYVFVESGWGKLHNLDNVIGFFTDLGIPAPQLQAPFVASVEFGGGLLVILGLATRVISIPLMATMAVALLTAKREDIHGLGDLFGSEEFLMALGLFWLVIYGAGKVSVDHLISKKSRRA